MYFRFSLRHNPAKGKSDAYYRLIENYRNETDRVCHKTLLNVGFLDDTINNGFPTKCELFEKDGSYIAVFDFQIQGGNLMKYSYKYNFVVI